MLNLKLKGIIPKSGIIFIIGLILLVDENGYCIFRSDVDPLQVKSAVILRREKDENRKQQAEWEKKDKEAKKEYNQTTDSSAASGARTANPLPAGQAQQPVQDNIIQYQRMQREKGSVAVAAQKQKSAKQNTVSQQKAKPMPSPYGFIVLIAVVLLLGKFLHKKYKTPR
ncbi:MAG: hypothetical protein HY810_06370 [Candidatus Omnitrophica bacterium]|nr:hypothetical protein [Candidatus Omnitrophota bacterium]